MSQIRDYPRVCGEKFRPGDTTNSLKGSPPRMRGKAILSCCHRSSVGITPAHAGKRPPAARWNSLAEGHPRMCGEKLPTVQQTEDIKGSPPRMRGKVLLAEPLCADVRITPAYAGKSGGHSLFVLSDGDHPRVCGEKPEGDFFFLWEKGSPPRVRGKASFFRCLRPGDGITPACAGKRYASSSL